MVLLHSVVSRTAFPRLHEQLAAECSKSSAMHEPGVLITGPPRSGRSSLALQCAVSAATAGSHVVYLCAEDNMLQRLPKSQVPLEELPPDALARIEFHYVHSLADVRGFVATVLAECPTPAVIVVDDDQFTDAGDRGDAAKTLAALAHAVGWARTGAADSWRDAASWDEHGPHSCFFVFATHQPTNPQWPGGPASTFPWSRQRCQLSIAPSARASDFRFEAVCIIGHEPIAAMPFELAPTASVLRWLDHE